MLHVTGYMLYLFGFLPSIIWLLFYLRKDKHPEPNRMVLKVFLYGMLIALVAIFLEKGFQVITTNYILIIFLGGALIEEYLKYSVVRIGIYRNSELDEPTDLVLYMIISALGFAALENILVLTNYHPFLTATKALEVMGWRFVSATFLHALCSGTLGYFLAMAFYHTKRRFLFYFSGLVIVTILHGLYNFSIIKIPGPNKFILPILIFAILFYFVSFSFKKLKRLKSTCKIDTKYE